MSKIADFFIASESNDYRPGALSYKAFLIYGLIILLFRLILGVLPAHSAAVESQTLMDLINTERSSRNLTVLITNASLLTAANQKSQDMIDRDFFAHIDPDGNYVWPKIMTAGYGQYKILGENLAVDFSTSEGMIKAWLDSPTHRANLLHTDFLEQGLVALYGDFEGRYTNLTTSLFGARVAGTQAPEAPQPAPPPPPPEPFAPEPSPVVKPPPPAPHTQPPPVPSKVLNPAPSSTKPALTPAFSGTKTAQNTPIFDFTDLGRVVFTLLGLGLLCILAIDSVIILRHETAVIRSHSSSHLFNLMLLILVSILIWWW